MKLEINEETKVKIINSMKKFWYIIVVIVVISFSTIQWQSKQNIQDELTSLQNKVNISEDIKTLESKLDSMKLRELEYLNVYESQDKLTKILIELDKRTKELNKQKKERIEIDVKALSTKDLSSAFNSLNFPNSIISNSK